MVKLLLKASLFSADFSAKDLSFQQLKYLGRMIFSSDASDANSLKVLNLTEGGWRKGLAPKLNSHCW